MTWLTPLMSNLHAVLFKQVKRAHALSLAFVAVDRLGLDAALNQIFSEALDAVLGAAEDKHLAEAGLYEEVVQNIELVFAVRYAHDILVDSSRGLLCFN